MPCSTATFQGGSEALIQEVHVVQVNSHICKNSTPLQLSKTPVCIGSIAPQSYVNLQLRVRGDLALGYVALDAVVQRSLQLSNSGLNTATYRVEVEAGLPLQVTPADGKLGPTGSAGSTCTLKVELTAEISGPLSGTVHQGAES